MNEQHHCHFGKKNGHGHSRHPDGKSINSCCSSDGKKPIYQNKVFLVTVVLAVLLGLSYVLSFLEPFRASFFMYVKTIWWAILLGLFVGGFVDHFIPQTYISHILAQKQKRTIFKSVFLGFLMSACCHGVLAIAIQLYKKGASIPAVVAFLLASPWANLPLTLVLIGFFGFTKAMYIIVVALIIAVTTGLIFQILESRQWIEDHEYIVKVDQDFDILADIKKRKKAYNFSLEQFQKDIRGIWQGSVSLSNMVLWWILIGMGLASLAGAYIPQNIFHQYMGPSIGGMFVTLVVATILEVCSEGTAPLAFELWRQTGALGNSLVFLMAGVATDYTEIGLLWTNVGKKTAIWLPIIAVPQIIAWGLLANMIF